MENYLEINTDNITPPEDAPSLLEARSNAATAFMHNDEEINLSIAVIAYNRLEKTKNCVKHLISHTNIPFRLVLIDSGSEPDIMEFYKSVDYPDKQIIRITKNINANYAFWIAMNNMKSRYCAIVSNDIIVTPNAIDNLFRCISSANDIGWVTPVSSNVSNNQQVGIMFETEEEMFEKARNFNQSDPNKWHERMVLMPAIIMYRRECVDIVGGFDYGFFHDFADDDFSRRINRAGYRTILCKDTWVHHDHNYKMDESQQEHFKGRLLRGRKNFTEKYGFDAWEAFRNYEMSQVYMIRKPRPKECYRILGIDARGGVPVLEIRNHLRDFGINSCKLEGFLSAKNAKYYADLGTVCEHVVCDRIEFLNEHYDNASFDYIILGEPINVYGHMLQLIKQLVKLLVPGGQLLLKLKNNFSNKLLRYSLGEFMDNMDDIPSMTISPEKFSEYIVNLGCYLEPVFLDHILTKPDELAKLKEYLDTFNTDRDNGGISARLMAQNFLFIIVKAEK